MYARRPNPAGAPLACCTDAPPQGGNIMPSGIEIRPLYAGIALALVGGLCISRLSSPSKDGKDAPGLFKSFFLFFYSSFIKPHQGDSKANQQDALESFYKTQAGAYDATRKVLLHGREDMLGLVAAQLESKALEMKAAGKSQNRRIWVDVGGQRNPRSRLPLMR